MQAYPLHWPQGFPRTQKKVPALFRTGLGAAVNKVQASLCAFARDTEKSITGLVVSSNVTLMDREPRDGGVAIYFHWDGLDCCIAVDRYTHPKDNLMAIVHILEAERTKLRHGGLNIVRAAFRGYVALPPPKTADGQIEKPWWAILGFSQEEGLTLDMIDRRWREMVKEHHPDRGGDAAEFNRITDAVRGGREALSCSAVSARPSG